MPDAASNERVSTLELFFDLVFVFTITQVATLVFDGRRPADLGTPALLLTIAWWMYGGYAWLTNNIRLDTTGTRLLILTGTAAYFVMALSIPLARTTGALAFGAAFTTVGLVHLVMFLRAPNTPATAILRIAPYNISGAAFTLVAAALPPELRPLAWLAAVACFLASTFRRGERGFHVGAAHFAERHGLVIIVAIGESIVSLGAGARGVTPRLLSVVLLGFAFCAGIWWSYFDADDVRGEHAMRALADRARARVALLAYGYAHLGMIAGIVGIAAGLHAVIAARGGPLDLYHAALLSGGAALYLLSDKWFRSLLRLGTSHARFVAAVTCAGLTIVGVRSSGASLVAALLGVLVVMIAFEKR